MKFVSSMIVCALVAAGTTGCGDAPCSGPACRVDVKTPDSATTTPSAEWSTAATTKDCANGGDPVEVDNQTLYYAEESATGPTPHKPAVTATMHRNQPLLLWRAICNKSSDAAGAQSVSWSRALCVNANSCASPVALGTSAVVAQDKCTCQPVFFEDRVGDTAGEDAGIYKYSLSFNAAEIASAIVRVE